MPVCCDILSLGRPLPLSKEAVHEALKAAFLGHEATAIGLITRRSSELTTSEFSEYCNKIEAHFRSEFAAVFPDDPDMVTA